MIIVRVHAQQQSHQQSVVQSHSMHSKFENIYKSRGGVNTPSIAELVSKVSDHSRG